MKKIILGNKTCLTLVGSQREKNIFRAHYLFWPNMYFLDPKQPKLGKPIKLWFHRKLPRPEMTLFFEKGLFGMGEKWFVLPVFLKSCVLLKTQFL